MDRSVPPGEIQGELTPPCSKSYAQRALAAALLAEGESTLRNIELCDDTRSAMRCIKALGADVTVVDSHTLKIRGGLAPRGRTLHVGESGLSTRLFTPIAALAGVPLRIEGEGTLLRRPMTMMIAPLRQLGVEVHHRDGFLPFDVCGPLHSATVEVDGSVSSQFITGLLLALPAARGEFTIDVRRAISTPYIDMTVEAAHRFGAEILHNGYTQFYIEGGQRYRPTDYSIEGDWSAAATLLVAGAVAGEVTLHNVSILSKQADTAVCTALVRAGAEPDPRSGSHHRPPPSAPGLRVRRHAVPRLFPAAGGAGRRLRRRKPHHRHVAPCAQGERPRRDAARGVRQGRHRDRPLDARRHAHPRRCDPSGTGIQPRRPPHRHVDGRLGAAFVGCDHDRRGRSGGQELSAFLRRPGIAARKLIMTAISNFTPRRFFGPLHTPACRSVRGYAAFTDWTHPQTPALAGASGKARLAGRALRCGGVEWHVAALTDPYL